MGQLDVGLGRQLALIAALSHLKLRWHLRHGGRAWQWSDGRAGPEAQTSRRRQDVCLVLRRRSSRARRERSARGGLRAATEDGMWEGTAHRRGALADKRDLLGAGGGARRPIGAGDGQRGSGLREGRAESAETAGGGGRTSGGGLSCCVLRRQLLSRVRSRCYLGPQTPA